jgi:hypothetical protein
VCELLQGDHPRLVDTLIGVSPLTHLAMASGNDLLHNQRLYQHSNLAVLPYAYPGLGELAWSYGVAASLLMLAPLALWFQGRRTADTVRTRSTSEKAPS